MGTASARATTLKMANTITGLSESSEANNAIASTSTFAAATRDGSGQDFLDPTRPVNFKIIAG